MKIGLYDPYLDTLGGGEKAFLTVLEEAVKVKGAEVILMAPLEPDVRQWRRLGIHIPAGSFSFCRTDDGTLEQHSDSLDVMFVMHSGIPPASRAGRSVAMIQFPFELFGLARKRDWLSPVKSTRRRLDQRRRLATYDKFVCNSEFTKGWLRKRLGLNPIVTPPPVDIPLMKHVQKQPIIMAVGRFITHGHHKRQDLMVDAFRRLHEQLGEDSDWSFHLVGGADDSLSTKRYLAALKKAATGLPVEFHVNASYRELVSLYRKASIFWHATGAGEDANKYPERLEHFGITTVEAMMYGLVPIVIGLGGQLEIIEDGKTGYLWQTLEELVDRTREVIDDPKRRAIMGKDATKAARRFSKQNYVKHVRSEILGIR